MKRKIFIRFFSVTLVAVLLMFSFGILAVRINADTMMRARLRSETELICALLSDESDFQHLEKYEHDDAFRITVLDTEGSVLYESDTRAPLENHASREEVQRALSGSPTAVTRYSETLGFNMTYYAGCGSLASGQTIVVRVAIRSSQIGGYIGVALPLLIGVLLIALCVSLLVSNLLSRGIASRINAIGVSLRSLNDGDYQPIRTDSSEPELYAVLSEINELSESTHAQMRRLTEEHSRLDTVLSNVSQGIIALEGGGRIVFANRSALALFDTACEVTGRELMYLMDDMALSEQIGQHLGEEYQTECTYRGRKLAVTVHRAETAGRDGAPLSLVILTDITAERQLQQQKSDFFANASHELKTPVTVMQGLSELLLAKTELDAASHRQIERIHSESLRLASLISDMLKLSRLESGAPAQEAAGPVDCRAVVQEVIGELQSQIEARGLTVSLTGDATVYATSGDLYEIVQNLLSNAVHYNREGGEIAVTLTSRACWERLRISDTGIGIEQEHLPRLCERFYRVDKSRSKKTGGTGLGLAIVKHLCAQYGATLSIESEAGVGTAVTVDFPAEQRAGV